DRVLTVRRQAQLLAVSRASVYYRLRPVSDRDLKLMRRLDELHLQAPFYGARKLAAALGREGHAVGAEELRTELYRALSSAVCRATKVFLGQITKRATEAPVL